MLTDPARQAGQSPHCVLVLLRCENHRIQCNRSFANQEHVKVILLVGQHMHFGFLGVPRVGMLIKRQERQRVVLFQKQMQSLVCCSSTVPAEPDTVSVHDLEKALSLNSCLVHRLKRLLVLRILQVKKEAACETTEPGHT